MIGVPFGIAAIIIGLASKKAGGVKLAVTGGLGIALTVVLYGSLFYFGFVKRGGIYDDLRAQMAQDSLNGVARSVEFYKLQNGSYPESLKILEDSLPKGSTVFVFDPTEIKYSGTSRYFYYEKVGADHYYLRGLGPDGTPFTRERYCSADRINSG